jgi:hypothetical protein
MIRDNVKGSASVERREKDAEWLIFGISENSVLTEEEKVSLRKIAAKCRLRRKKKGIPPTEPCFIVEGGRPSPHFAALESIEKLYEDRPHFHHRHVVTTVTVTEIADGEFRAIYSGCSVIESKKA